ncbi:MAG: response regulator transcription factor, partial [Ktedonobacteraceae bacterium]|nr:response regulator transcription factor [Ktedonobacteraceae bacterium]
MITILVVDEHPLTRRVIRDVLEKENDLEVIAEATSGQDAEWQASRVQPDVVVMNRDMPDCNGFEAMERIVACSPNSHVVIFTPDFQAQHIVPAIQKGAMSYISKDIEPDAFVHA